MKALKNLLTLSLFVIQVLGLQAQTTSDVYYEDGEVLVLLEKQASIASLSDAFEKTFGTALSAQRRLAQSMPLWLVTFNSEMVSTVEAFSFLDRSPWVAIAQLNHTNISIRATPDDPSFGEQWAFFNDGTNGGSGTADIDALAAWDVATGGLTPDGDTIVVAVIDGGFNLNHPDLAPNFFVNHDEIPNNFIDDDGNGYVDDVSGWNVYNNSGSHFNDNHGNHVAGTVGAKGNNGIGVTGVNWDVKILPISGSSSNDATVAAAYGYVLDMRKRYNESGGTEGAYVVSTNASFGVDFGDPANFPLWCAIYDSLGYAGVLSAGATANLNVDIDAVGDVPTACPSSFLLSVTNTTSSDVKNNGAAYGATTIDIGAPGTSIHSTLVNGYGDLTGTSMATPHVAGTVALMYNALCPDIWGAYQNDPAGLALYIKEKLLSDGVDPLNSLNGLVTSGGRLNLNGAVSSVANNCFTVVLEATNTACGNCDGSIVATPVGGASPFQYQWSNGSNGVNMVNSLCAGQYTVTVIDANLDTAISTVSISDSTGPEIDIILFNVSCHGGEDGTVSLIGADYFLWPDGDTSANRSDLGAGVYYVTASADGNPCNTVVEVQITEPSEIIVSYSSILPTPVTGSNGSLSLTVSGGTPGYAYLWSNGMNAAQISGLDTGVYSVIVTDVKGCSVEEEVLLGFPAGYRYASSETINVYPNPTNDYINISAPQASEAFLSLIDVLGRTVHQETMTGKQLSVDVRSLNHGVYFVRLEMPEQVFIAPIQISD